MMSTTYQIKSPHEIQNDLDNQPWYQRVVTGTLFLYHRYRVSRLVDRKLLRPLGNLIDPEEPLFNASDESLSKIVDELYSVRPFTKQINSRPSTK